MPKEVLSPPFPAIVHKGHLGENCFVNSGSKFSHLNKQKTIQFTQIGAKASVCVSLPMNPFGIVVSNLYIDSSSN